MYGAMRAYMRTAPQMVSPEPGLVAGSAAAGAAAHQRPQLALHPYSPASPLAPSPAPEPADRQGVTPASVCSNTGFGGAGSRPSPVPPLQLGSLRRAEAATRAAEIKLAPPVCAEQQVETQLPTARLAAEAQQQPAGAAARGSPPISFRLPGDSPLPAAQPQQADRDSPSFSFGFGAGGAPGAAGVAAASADENAEPTAEPAHHRVESGESVLGPHPFKAMLRHLQGPQYTSPAQPQHAAAAGDPATGSPQSPKECTPLHLISTSAGTPAGGAGAAWSHWHAVQAHPSARCVHAH